MTDFIDGQAVRVRYRDSALPGPSYSRPLTLESAKARVKLLELTDKISEVEIVPVDAVERETADSFRVEGEGNVTPEQMLKEAEAHREAAQERVKEDLDASLEESEPAVGLDLAGTAPVLDTWSRKQNRHTALDHAMKLATMPMGGMVVQTSGPTPEHVIETARKFLAFLNEEGPRA